MPLLLTLLLVVVKNDVNPSEEFESAPAPDTADPADPSLARAEELPGIFAGKCGRRAYPCYTKTQAISVRKLSGVRWQY